MTEPPRTRVRQAVRVLPVTDGGAVLLLRCINPAEPSRAVEAASAALDRLH